MSCAFECPWLWLHLIYALTWFHFVKWFVASQIATIRPRNRFPNPELHNMTHWKKSACSLSRSGRNVNSNDVDIQPKMLQWWFHHLQPHPAWGHGFRCIAHGIGAVTCDLFGVGEGCRVKAPSVEQSKTVCTKPSLGFVYGDFLFYTKVDHPSTTISENMLTFSKHLRQL